ncbi:autotransporter outer membrane beta-barrel domain-containing protein [Aliarcobacter cryaerophilus]|uniref:autotransporter family protein n=2 Tax=Aliarcobacter cryaerophilus TaxID=28198 RepID=UPI00082530E3|nr:autotransporter outer membrane beta-barrel domain-containing protein [Aliarcobacter cryaerophilus]
MISRYIDNFDFKSRFRILKGGKVSLVVSAMIVSSSLVGTNANAASYNFDVNNPISVLETNSTAQSIENITKNDGSTIDIDGNSYSGLDINVGHNVEIDNSNVDSGIRISELGEDSSINIFTNKILKSTHATSDSWALNIIGGASGLTLENNGTIEASAFQDYSESIYIDTDLIGSTITNNLGALIKSTGTGINTSSFGIDIGNDLVNSNIKNDGTFDISSNNGAYGIYVDRDVENSQVINNGDMTIKVERDLVNADVQTQDSTELYSSGIEVKAVRQHTAPAGGTINIANSSNINSSATGNLTVTGNIESGLGEEAYTNLIAEAKGITINLLEGDEFVQGAISTFLNNGEITATSKLNLDFINQDDSINFNWGYFNATSTALEVDGSDAHIYNYLDGKIKALSQINIDPKGTISSYYLFAEANGIKSNDLEDVYFFNLGNIDSTAIFNGSNYSGAISNGINLEEVDNSIINTLNTTVKAEAKNYNNQGRAWATANGLSVENSVENSSTIGNGGLLSVDAKVSNTSDGYAKANGLYFQNSVNNSSIANVKDEGANGVIKVNSESTSYDFSSAKASGIYAEDGFYDSSIQNSGDITVKSKATSIGESGNADAEAHGIYADTFQGFNTDSSKIVNIGKIDVLAEADSYNYSNSEAYGIYVSSYGGAKIENSGNIKANAKSTIVEGDSIWAESYGINAYHSAEGEDFIINNSGTIEAYSNNKLDSDAYSLYISSSYPQSVIVTNSGTLKGNIYVEGILTNNGTSNNKAIIELAHNAMDEDSAYISNFTNGEHGILKIGLLTDGTIGNTKYSQLNTQSAVFNDGSTIDVNVLSASTNQPLLAGKRLENVVRATTALTINDKLNITDNSALLNFKYVTSDGWTNGGIGAIHLDVVKSSENNIIDNTVSGGGNQNSQNAATALQNVYNSNPEIQSAFNNLRSAQEVASAVQSTTALTPTATVGATTQIANGIAGIVTQRQNANISGGGLNSGDTMFAQKNFWFKPFGSLGSQKDKDGISGFDVKAGGFGLGLDGEYKDNQNIGFGLFYTNANVDVNNVNQKADLDVFTTLVYGNVPVIDDKTNFLYQVGYSWQKTDGSREIFTGQTATSDYTSKTASLDLKLMRDVQITDNLLLQPMVETTYRHFTNPAYKENGAGALNLNVDKFTSKDLIVGLGTIAHYKLTDDSKIVGNVNVGYDFESKNQTVTSAFQGAAGVKFDTNGIDNGRWSYQAGIGYELDINKTNSINVSYDYQGQGSDFSNNTVSAKYVLKF